MRRRYWRGAECRPAPRRVRRGRAWKTSSVPTGLDAEVGSHGLSGSPPPARPVARGRRIWNALIADRRRTLAISLGALGILLHNWWIVIYPLHWMPSWNALISEAEATNQPHGGLLSALDIAVGVLVIVALLLQAKVFLGRLRGVGRAVWWWAMTWAVAGLMEGAFPLACSPSSDKKCEHVEWTFRLAVHHYVHMGSGVVEYLAATFVVIAAWRCRKLGWLSRFGKAMTITLIVAYPFIAVTFFTHRWSTISEAVFFVLFSAIIGAVISYRPPVETLGSIGTTGPVDTFGSAEESAPVVHSG